MRRTLLICLLLASVPGYLHAEDSPQQVSPGYAVGAVRGYARFIERSMEYCSARFPDTTAAATEAVQHWHARNGRWERAADQLYAAARANYVETQSAADGSAFDLKFDEAMSAKVEPIIAQFDALPSDEARKEACMSLMAKIDFNQHDIDARFPNTLPLLQKYLKK